MKEEVIYYKKCLCCGKCNMQTKQEEVAWDYSVEHKGRILKEVNEDGNRHMV